MLEPVRCEVLILVRLSILFFWVHAQPQVMVDPQVATTCHVW